MHILIERYISAPVSAIISRSAPLLHSMTWNTSKAFSLIWLSAQMPQTCWTWTSLLSCLMILEVPSAEPGMTMVMRDWPSTSLLPTARLCTL